VELVVLLTELATQFHDLLFEFAVAPAEILDVVGTTCVQRFWVVLELSGPAGIVSDRARVPRLPVEGKLHVLNAGAYHFRRRHAIPADRKAIRLHLRLATQD